MRRFLYGLALVTPLAFFTHSSSSATAFASTPPVVPMDGPAIRIQTLDWPVPGDLAELQDAIQAAHHVVHHAGADSQWRLVPDVIALTRDGQSWIAPVRKAVNADAVGLVYERVPYANPPE